MKKYKVSSVIASLCLMGSFHSFADQSGKDLRTSYPTDSNDGTPIFEVSASLGAERLNSENRTVIQLEFSGIPELGVEGKVTRLFALHGELSINSNGEVRSSNLELIPLEFQQSLDRKAVLTTLGFATVQYQREMAIGNAGTFRMTAFSAGVMTNSNRNYGEEIEGGVELFLGMDFLTYAIRDLVDPNGTHSMKNEFEAAALRAKVSVLIANNITDDSLKFRLVIADIVQKGFSLGSKTDGSLESGVQAEYKDVSLSILAKQQWNENSNVHGAKAVFSVKF